jgi:hypothetical protein
MYRQRSRAVQVEQRIAGRALLDADDYSRVEEVIDAAAALRRTMRLRGPKPFGYVYEGTARRP